MNTADVFLIHDQTALAAVVDGMVGLIGTETRTAERLGVSQSTVNRMRNRALEKITRNTVIALERAAKLLNEELLSGLRDALVPPTAQEYLWGYNEWCQERTTRWQERDGKTWRIGPLMRAEPSAGPGYTLPVVRQEFLRLLWKRVHQEFPEVFRKFREEMKRRSVDGMRQEVAITRIIEPLLEATQSAYVERSYSELTERERRDFIDAGIKRELILLDREPAITRARRLAEEGADTFAKQQGEHALYAKERAPAPPPNGMVS
jgi:DNA-binding transcriptional regulator YdaS (Cro superfamily)